MDFKTKKNIKPLVILKQKQLVEIRDLNFW